MINKKCKESEGLDLVIIDIVIAHSTTSFGVSKDCGVM